MRSLLAAVAALAVASGTAAADSIALPGTDLVLVLPDHAYMVMHPAGASESGSVLATADQNTMFKAIRRSGSCADLLAAQAQRVGTQIESVDGLPSDWVARRTPLNPGTFSYCRDGDADAVVLVSNADTPEQIATRLVPVMRAIDAALAPPPPPPATAAPPLTLAHVGVTIESPPGTWSVDSYDMSGKGDYGDRIQGGTSSGAGVAVFATAMTGDSTCSEFLAQMSDGTVETHAAAYVPTGWYEETFEEHSEPGIAAAWMCAAYPGGLITALVKFEGSLGDPSFVQALQAVMGPMIAAKRATITSTPPAVATADDPPAASTEPAAPAAPDAPSVSSDSSTHHEAGFETPRWGVVGGQSTLDGGGETHLFGAARVTMAPRFPDDDADSGVSYAAGATAGANGDAFVGDLYGSLGYGLSGGGLSAHVLTVFGADRVGGGFVPIAGAYLGVQATARIGFSGAFAVEGSAMMTSSTSVDETRVEVGVATHVGDRVISIDGTYERWNEIATLYGVSIGLTR